MRIGYVGGKMTEQERMKQGKKFNELPIEAMAEREALLHEIFGEVGENSVIVAGSVVTKDIPPNVIAFGVPCKVHREITDRGAEYYFGDRRFDEQPERK